MLEDQLKDKERINPKTCPNPVQLQREKEELRALIEKLTDALRGDYKNIETLKKALDPKEWGKDVVVKTGKQAAKQVAKKKFKESSRTAGNAAQGFFDNLASPFRPPQ